MRGSSVDLVDRCSRTFRLTGLAAIVPGPDLSATPADRQSAAATDDGPLDLPTGQADPRPTCLPGRQAGRRPRASHAARGIRGMFAGR